MSKLNIIILVVVSNLCLITCTNKKDKIKLNNNLILFSDFPKKENIYFKKLVEDSIGVPTEFHFIDTTTMIIFNNYRNKYYFYNYSLVNNSFSKEYIARGRGPSEAIMGFCSGLNSNTLWMYDIGLNKILATHPTTTISYNKILKIKTYTLKQKFYKVVLINNGHFLGIGNMNTHFKIQKIDLISSKVIKEFGEFETIPENIPFDVCKKAYESNIYLKPSGEKIVLPYRYTNVIEIYNLNDYSSVAIQEIDGFDVDFSTQSSTPTNMKNTKKTRRAFLRGGVTDKYIFLLYSGRVSTDNNWNYGKYVYVYDWDGNPVKKLILDRDINKLGVSKDGKTLYSYDDKTGYILKAEIN